MHTQEILQLTIARFVIQITFHKSDYLLAEIFISDIKKIYKNFISRERKKKVNFYIDFVDSKTPDVTIKNKYGYWFGLLYKKKKEKKIISFYHIGTFNFQFLLRRILSQILKENKAFLLHASASLINNTANIFIGKSGAGKSTIMRLLSNSYPALADDSALIKREENQFYFYQTPFFEKEFWLQRNPKRHQLGSVFFIKKAKSNKITKIENKRTIIDNISKQAFLSTENNSCRIPGLTDFVKSYGKFYFFYFKKDEEELVRFIKKISRNV